MSEKTIRRLKIENFKSIDSLEVKGLAPFSVFAGANGSGKSNFFDALDFVGLFVRGGLEIALSEHGGFANIYSKKRAGADSKKFRPVILSNGSVRWATCDNFNNTRRKQAT